MYVLVLCVLIVVAAIAANVAAAVSDFRYTKFAMANSIRVGVPKSWLPMLGTLKVAGALGLLLGLSGVPYIGVAASVGLVLFFLGAIGAHLRAREHHHVRITVGYFLLAVAALAASLAI